MPGPVHRLRLPALLTLSTAVLGAVALLAVAPPQAAEGATTAFHSAPFGQNEWYYPDVQFDSSGIEHVAFDDVTGNTYYTNNASGSFSDPVPVGIDYVNCGSGYCGFDYPQVLIDSGNHVHVLFGRTTLKVATKTGSTWQVTNTGLQESPSDAVVAADSTGRVFVAKGQYPNYNDIGPCHNMLGMISNGVLTTLNVPDPINGMTCRPMGMAVRSDDALVLAYMNAGVVNVSGPELMTTVYKDGAWSPPIGTGLQPAFIFSQASIDPAGHLHLVSGGSPISETSDASGSWTTTSLPFTGQPTQMAIDSEGTSHLSFEDNLGRWRYASRTGSTWSSSVDVQTTDHQSMALDPEGRTHIVWCVLDKPNDPSTSQPWEAVDGVLRGTFHATSPERVLDTRPTASGHTNIGLTGKFTAGTVRTFGVAGVHYVNAAGKVTTGTTYALPSYAIAITGNVTIVGETAAGVLALGPTMTATGATTTINFVKGDIVANNVTMGLGPDGTLSAVYRSSTAGATVDVIFDVTGYFLADASGATYHPVAPGRVLDTRPTSGSRIHIGLSGKFTNKAVRTIAVAGVKGLGWSSALVPANATAITANLTIVNATSAGFASLGPTVAAVPKTSTINVAAGKIIANGVTVSLRSGTIQAVWDGTNGSSADFLLDVTGYFLSGSGGLSFYPLDPYRVLDSSQGTGLSGSFATGTARTLAVGGTGGSAGVPADAAGIAGNLTLVSPSSAGYAVVSPSISGIPSSSTVNTSAGVSVANGFDVPLDTTGQLMLGWYGTIGSTANLSLDVNGYWK